MTNREFMESLSDENIANFYVGQDIAGRYFAPSSVENMFSRNGEVNAVYFNSYKEAMKYTIKWLNEPHTIVSNQDAEANQTVSTEALINARYDIYYEGIDERW